MGSYKWDYQGMGYVRWQEYDEGRKNRTNSPFAVLREWEIRLEWQFRKGTLSVLSSVELLTMGA